MYFRKAIFCILLFWVIGMVYAQSEKQYAFQNPQLPIQQRVEDLLRQLTLEEKISQMMHTAAAIPRLGIPEYNWWNEALHGVARAGTATVFPQAIGLAATWDEDLIYRLATVISIEARAKHHEFVRRGKRGMYQGLTFWSPNINIFRDPRWGRGQETYGEDPFLTGRLGAAFVRGMQGEDVRYFRTIATPKHFAVHSGPEPERHHFDARVDERDLRLTYLPAFEMCLRQAGAFSVMCAYNRLDGEPCCANKRLLTDILRGEWGFKGYVVSDCWAISDIYNGHKTAADAAEAAAQSVKAGCDLSCGPEFGHLIDAVKRGLISQAEIDSAVARLFTARMRLGMFDPPAMVNYAQIPYSENDTVEHDQLALEAAQKSLVLLKNENRTLPLDKSISSIAVIGPNADDVEVLLGNYNGTPSHPVTPLQGLREKLGAHRVHYALGCHWAENMPVLSVVPKEVFFTDLESKKPGLWAEYYDNLEFRGEPLFRRIEPNIDANWRDGSPDPRLDADHFAVRWSGILVPPISGEYQLGGYGFNGFRIYLEDKLLVEFKGSHHPNKKYATVKLQKNKPYRLRVEFYQFSGDAHMQLIWSVPHQKLEEEALAAVKKAQAAILFLGLSPRLEGEEMDVPVSGFRGGDRIELGLPPVQERLLQKITALGKPVVLVLLSGSALAVNWAEAHVPAIIQAWYPGQRAGTAIADVLFGDYNPAGRLPITFYRSAVDLPPFEQYAMAGRTYRYFNGIPLYPFGYGLSYTRFSYSNLKLNKNRITAGDSLMISVDVNNVGQWDGDEVVQAYLTDEIASAPVPIRSLVGFRRLHLKAGEKKTIRFVITPRQFSLIDENMQRVIEPGWFTLSIGGCQPQKSGYMRQVTTEYLTTRVEVIGEKYFCN